MTTEKKEKVTLTVSGLKECIEKGMTRPEIAKHFGLAPNQIKQALEQAGLNKMRAKIVKFELVDDSEKQMKAPQDEETGQY